MLNQKQVIREKISNHIQSLPEATLAGLSRKIIDRLIHTDLFQEAKCIALYYAIGNEVRTSELIDEWNGKKQLFLPCIAGENMQFRPYSGKENLKKGAYGIPEPGNSISKAHHDVLDTPGWDVGQDGGLAAGLYTIAAIDLFIVPGIAFDFDCNRLGRGKGYYDRYLSGINKPVIGLCYACQLVAHVPTENHDIKMTRVITENTTITIVPPHRQ